ncbi:MAG: SMUG2 DNA glycosylase family protein [Desulfovibrio sp.]|nr:SMUG2 DNA glycosylase family protein [Desulfovibrio sp.]
MTFGENVIAFNLSLDFPEKLPPGIGVMNPFRENNCAIAACEAFYGKYYDDHNQRFIILGINPGRFGAGITGVPFTDPKRLKEKCGIVIPACPPAHEPSSEFVYAVIAACGGPGQFYRKWYINSLCPLGFTRMGKQGKPINYNYYDSAELARLATPFIVRTLWEQIGFGIERRACICLGTGKNAQFLEKLNQEHGFFRKIIPVEHPRYIMQYKKPELAVYIDRYREAFAEAIQEQGIDRTAQ